jgi:O-antigen/teichoic acid export membrane protein
MIVKNTFYSTINAFLRFSSTALLYIILARALGVEEFGRFAFAEAA